MKTPILIPIVPTTLNGLPCQMVDARVLHAFLEVKRDFSNWIKGRIEEFGFERVIDFIWFDSPNPANQTTRGGDRRSIDYFLDCERQLRQLQQSMSVNVTRQPIALSRGQRQAINRQAWADVSGQAQAAFHARREQLQCECIDKPELSQRCVPEHLLPLWVRLEVCP